VGNREKGIREGVGKESMDVRCTNMGDNGLRGGDMGVEGEEADKEGAGEVPEMGVGSWLESAGIHGERGNAERETESESWEEGVGRGGLRRGWQRVKGVKWQGDVGRR